jgi:hypothetical protein
VYVGFTLSKFLLWLCFKSYTNRCKQAVKNIVVFAELTASLQQCVYFSARFI